MRWMSGRYLNEETDGGGAGNEGGTDDQPAGVVPSPDAGADDAGSTPGNDPQATLVAEYQAQLAAQKEELARYEQRWKATQALMQGDASEDDVNESLKYILREGGYSEDQIQQYMESQNVQPDNTPQAPPSEAIQKELDQLKAEQAAMNAARLRGVLEGELSTATTHSSEFDQFMAKITEIQGKDAAAKVRETLTAEAKEATLKGLRDRRQQNQGRFEEGWIGEEATKGLSSVVQKYRSVIGPLDKIGVVPETVTGLGSVLNKEPVPAPEYKPGLTANDAGQMTRDFAVDTLLRAANDDGSTQA